MSKRELNEHLEALQRRLVITAVLAIGLLVWRSFTSNIIIVLAFWAATLYIVVLFAIWLWLEWQLLFRQ